MKNVFLTIANLPLDQNINPGSLENFILGMGQQRSPKFELLLVAINDNNELGDWVVSCDKDGTLQAYLGQKYFLLGDRGYMPIYELTFTCPSLGQIENLPAWAIDPRTGVVELGYGCDGFLDHDNDYMMSISGIILHQLIH